MAESGGNQNAGNNSQSSETQQRSDNQPKSNNQQGLDNQPKSTNQQESGSQPKPGKQPKSGNQQGSGNQPKSGKNQKPKSTADKLQQMSISSDKQQKTQQQKPLEGAWQKQAVAQQPSTSKEASKPLLSDTLSQARASSKQSTIKSAGETSPTTNMPHLLCPYKGAGTLGTKFRSPLETNYLKLIINKMKDCAYHYDVTITPDKPKKHMPKIFQQFCTNNFPSIGIAFDGSRNAYSPTVLSLNVSEIRKEVEFRHPDTGGVRTYTVNIKETEDMKIPLGSLRT